MQGHAHEHERSAERCAIDTDDVAHDRCRTDAHGAQCQALRHTGSSPARHQRSRHPGGDQRHAGLDCRTARYRRGGRHERVIRPEALHHGGPGLERVQDQRDACTDDDEAEAGTGDDPDAPPTTGRAQRRQAPDEERQCRVRVHRRKRGAQLHDGSPPEHVTNEDDRTDRQRHRSAEPSDEAELHRGSAIVTRAVHRRRRRADGRCRHDSRRHLHPPFTPLHE